MVWGPLYKGNCCLLVFMQRVGEFVFKTEWNSPKDPQFHKMNAEPGSEETVPQAQTRV